MVSTGCDVDLSSAGGSARWKIGSEGVVGALPAFSSVGGFKIIERS